MRIYLETERLILRNLTPEDSEAAFKWCGDPRVNTYLIYPLYHSAEQVRRWLETKNPEDPDNYDVGIALKETGELIGCGGLVYHPETDVWSLGYNICFDQWGHGYVPEAMNAIISLVQKERGIRVLEGEFAAANHKSQRVMEKLGMSFDRDAAYDKLDGSEHFPAKIFKKVF